MLTSLWNILRISQLRQERKKLAEIFNSYAFGCISPPFAPSKEQRDLALRKQLKVTAELAARVTRYENDNGRIATLYKRLESRKDAKLQEKRLALQRSLRARNIFDNLDAPDTETINRRLLNLDDEIAFRQQARERIRI